MRNFDQHQENALAQTAKLILLMSVAVGGTVLLTAIGVGYTVTAVGVLLTHETGGQNLWAPFAFSSIVTAPIVAIVVASGSLWKIYQLRLGGCVIAKDLGGTLVTERQQLDADHRKVLNVVQELSLASGIPVPPVYVLEHETGINAFAAGYSPQDAVIGVTSGCITRLTRDQLQGVIAHEFSHIFNGDMRLNIRAVGALHGVLTITLVAEHLMRDGWELMAYNHGHRDHSGIGVLMLVLGAVVWPMGLAGAFLAAIIRAAMNRQREYLADAYAVEFTRDPQGIAGALKVIGGYSVGSRVRTRSAAEVSHVFFAEGRSGLAAMLHSHPPLEARIRRIEPGWDGVPLFTEEASDTPYQGAFSATMGLVGGGARSQAGPPPEPSESNSEIEEQIAEVCGWNPYNEARLEELPAELVQLTAHDKGIGLLLSALWVASEREAGSLDASRAVRPSVLDVLDTAAKQPAEAIGELLLQQEAAHRLLLFDTAITAMSKNLSRGEASRIEDLGKRLAELPRPEQNSAEAMFQWLWLRIVSRTLADVCGQPRPRPRYGKLAQVNDQIETLVSALVHASDTNSMFGEYTFQRAFAQTAADGLQFRTSDQCTLDHLDLALDGLSQLAPRPRQDVLLACGACITADSEISLEEAYLIRAICSAFDYPLPSLLPGQPVTPGA